METPATGRLWALVLAGGDGTEPDARRAARRPAVACAALGDGVARRERTPLSPLGFGIVSPSGRRLSSPNCDRRIRVEVSRDPGDPWRPDSPRTLCGPPWDG